MSYGVFTPSTIDTSNDIFLGEGVVYKDYGEGGSAVIGATRGGSKLEFDRSIKMMEYDGSHGATKGLRRYETAIPKLVINFLKLNYTNFAYGLPVTVAGGTDADGTYQKISFDLEIADTDVLTNVTFKGQKHDGKVCLIKVLNALNIDKISLDFKEKDEVVAEMTYTGFYTAAAPTTCPLEVWDYV